MWVPEMTMPEAAEIFFDPEKTALIRFQYGDMEDTYEGYTMCTHLSTTEGTLSVCMKKGAKNNV
jgi:hypothetical protein